MSWCMYAAWRAAGEEHFVRFKWFQVAGRVAGEEHFVRFKWFQVRFQRFVSPLPTPCRRLLIISENGLVAFVNVTVCS
jgi:hypothetical protein